MTTIAIVDRMSTDPDLLLVRAQITQGVASLQVQVDRDHEPIYKTGLKTTLIAVPVGAKIPPGCWPLYLLNSSDEPGALGYHEAVGDVPDGKAFVLTDVQYKYNPWVTISHELLEMISDATTTRVARYGSYEYAYELCLSAATEVVVRGRGDVPIWMLAGEQDVPIWAVDGDGQLVPAHARSFRRTGQGARTFHITLSNGRTVRCTGDHRFLTADGVYRTAVSLRPGDRLASVAAYPRESLANTVDRSLVDTVSCCQDSGNGRIGEDVADCRFRQFGSWGLSPTGKFGVALQRLAPLRRHVFGIVAPSAEEEVVYANAERRVAVVANAHTVGNWAVRHRPSLAMCKHGSSCDPDLPVAPSAFRSRPEPTVAGLIDLGPEAFFQGGGTGVIRSNPPVEITVPVLTPPMGSAESFGADRTATPLNRTLHESLSVVVLSVEDAGCSDVYDFAVDTQHNMLLSCGIIAHNCDPCEADVLGYVINGITVSDFILPAWFGAAQKKTRYDFGSHLTAPRSLAPQGYMLRRKIGGQWQQVFAEKDGVVRPGTSGRSARRRLEVAA